MDSALSGLPFNLIIYLRWASPIARFFRPFRALAIILDTLLSLLKRRIIEDWNLVKSIFHLSPERAR